MRKFKLFLPLIILLSIHSFAQTKSDSSLVQFSGVVVTGDSLHPVPYTNIIVKGTYRGTISDYYGFFSFVAQKNDTIEFSCVGFKRGSFVIPDTLTDNRYSLIHVMTRDTILLNEVDILPWPTREQFKNAFLTLHIPDDDLERAKKNLNRYDMALRGEAMAPSGSINQKYALAKESSRLYYAGQLPPNNLLNPIAWAKFIQAWKNGDFKRKEKKE